jgi:hypothetical protein
MGRKAKPRLILTITLPAEFIALCEAHNIDSQGLIKGFIADTAGLIAFNRHGYYSNGAQARIKARAYFEEVYFMYERK